jgi:hypothetical protein
VALLRGGLIQMGLKARTELEPKAMIDPHLPLI